MGNHFQNPARKLQGFVQAVTKSKKKPEQKQAQSLMHMCIHTLGKRCRGVCVCVQYAVWDLIFPVSGLQLLPLESLVSY